jgi:serine/threonine-protein kinase
VSVSLEQFIQHLTDSGLMSAAEVSSFSESLPTDNRPTDGETFAQQLVEAKKRTPYQAEAVNRGEAKALVFDEYVVLDKIGQGGMGVVLKAQHRRMKRLVAVKILPPAAMKTPQAVEQFYREVEAEAATVARRTATTRRRRAGSGKS